MFQPFYSFKYSSSIFLISFAWVVFSAEELQPEGKIKSFKFPPSARSDGRVCVGLYFVDSALRIHLYKFI